MLGRNLFVQANSCYVVSVNNRTGGAGLVNTEGARGKIIAVISFNLHIQYKNDTSDMVLIVW